MKHRIYAKKSVVMDQLAEKGTELQEVYSEALEKIADLQNTNLYVDPAIVRVRQDLADAAQDDLDRHDRLVELVASHAPPEVMVEFET